MDEYRYCQDLHEMVIGISISDVINIEKANSCDLSENSSSMYLREAPFTRLESDSLQSAV
jgi:hypothetical protein